MAALIAVHHGTSVYPTLTRIRFGGGYGGLMQWIRHPGCGNLLIRKNNIFRTCCCCPLQGWRCTRPPQFADRMAWSLTPPESHHCITGKRSGFLFRRSPVRSYLLKLRKVWKWWCGLIFVCFPNFLVRTFLDSNWELLPWFFRWHTQEGHSGHSFWPRVSEACKSKILWAPLDACAICEEKTLANSAT